MLRVRDDDVTLLLNSAEALSIIDCGLSIKAQEFDLPDRRPSTAEDKHDRARASVQHLAQRMLVSERTAKRMVAALLHKIGADNRIAAAALAGRSGLLDTDS